MRPVWRRKWRALLKKKIERRLKLYLGRAVQAPRIVLFRALSTNRVVGAPRRSQPLHATGLGLISFGKDVCIGFSPSPAFFSTYAYIEARNPEASIAIGDGTTINNNFCAIAEHTRIAIGSDCLIGTNVEIYDSDFHGLAVAERHTSRPERASPVIIGDHVFIGSNVKILKGVTIGDGAVIGHGSLVTTDVAGGMIAAGVPARLIKAIR